MASKNVVEIIIKATDKASKEMKGLTSIMGKLGKGAAIAGAAVVAAGVVIGKIGYDLAKESANVERLRNTFDSLADSIGENADVMIKDLRVASRGMLNDADLMQASNKLVAMGLADTTEESSKLVEMSTQLGSAMGMDATDSAEAFALMLANQSIPRLDNFGISSDVVRDRIEELMKAEEGMTRETAFMQAVMEEGGKTMEKVGEQGEGAAANMARLEANVDNLKVEIGNRLRPVLETITDKLLVMWDDPQIQQGLDNLFAWLENVIGDNESGLVGIMTLLVEGNWAGAFDMAFGEGSYSKISKMVGYVDWLIGKLKDVYSDITRLIAIWDVYQRLSAPGGLGYNVAKYAYQSGASSGNSSYVNPNYGAKIGHARGGATSAGRTYIVGEEGPEVLQMGSGSGNVIPNNKLMGSVTVNLHIHSAVSLANTEEAKRTLLPFIESGLRTVMAR